MTEVEILDRFRRAHAALMDYRAIISPVADALAEMQSIDVFGEPGHYQGYLGGYDNGIDSVFLEVCGEAKISRDPESPIQKAHAFRDAWREKIGDACCVRLDGFG